MTIQEEEKQELFPRLSILTGGRGSDGYDWLGKLEIGDTFVCIPIEPVTNLICEVWTILDKKRTIVQLTPADGSDTFYWVPIKRFSKQREFLEVLSNGDTTGLADNEAIKE